MEQKVDKNQFEKQIQQKLDFKQAKIAFDEKLNRTDFEMRIKQI
jgi:hypothetical protein